MIPAKVTPIGLEEVAEILGMTKGSLVSNGKHRQEDFATDLNPGGRVGLWDPRQVKAYKAGNRCFDPYPERPTDWLNDYEAAQVAGVAPTYWRNRRLTRVDTVTREFHGVRYHLRSSIPQVENPGMAGRPRGVTDKVPRRSRKDADAARIAGRKDAERRGKTKMKP